MLGLILGLISAAEAGDFAMAKYGTALAEIVVSEKAGETERFAAEELALFLHLMTGAEFRAELRAGGEDRSPMKNRFLIGLETAKGCGFPLPADTLGPEEILIQTAGPDLVLAGGSPRGTLYAVYTFLEDILGCRWWTAQATRIPWRPDLKIKPFEIRFNPPLEYREPFWFAAFDSAWAARNKANGIRAGADDLRGGSHIYEGFVHTFYSLIPPDKYFRDHPEWFSEIKGERTPKNAQLCLTNEELRKELVKNLKERLRANPKATIASVSQNDCLNNCTCPQCAAVDAEEGSPSGSLLRFVNRVAEEVEKDFPHVSIDTLAYQYTRKPPRTTRPRPNVIVRLCSIECSFSRPLDDERNKAFYDDLKGWSQIAPRLYVWDYTTNFAHYIQPHPNYRVLAPNIRLFTANNVCGVFEQGAYQSTCSEMAELRAWVLAKLLWNPDRDPDGLERDFLEGYYGKAAGPISDYLDLIKREVDSAGDYLGCYSVPEAKFLSLENIIKAWRLLEAAEKKAARSREYSRRVQVAQLPILYVVLTRWESFREASLKERSPWPWPKDRRELLERFLSVARAEKATHISEWQSLDDWAAKGGRVK
jgi:hypothetical protein